jgi:hypothetical protein
MFRVVLVGRSSESESLVARAPGDRPPRKTMKKSNKASLVFEPYEDVQVWAEPQPASAVIQKGPRHTETARAA